MTHCCNCGRIIGGGEHHCPQKPTHKTCTACGVTQLAEEFPLRKSHNGKSYPSSVCRPCTTRNVGRWAAKNPEKRRAIWRKSAEGRRELHNKECREYYRRDKARRMASMQDYWARHPEKRAARHAVAYALQTGKLKKEPCVKCGSTFRLHAHHHDYGKPLDVTWLCSLCHGMEHRRVA